MDKTEDKRKARRAHFPEPVKAQLSHQPVLILDVSTSGARIQHEFSFPHLPHRLFVLEFEFERERFTMKCQVARSRIDRVRSSPKGMVYTSGLRFVDLDEDTTAALWGLLGSLAIGEVQQDGLLSADMFDFEILAH